MKNRYSFILSIMMLVCTMLMGCDVNEVVDSLNSSQETLNEADEYIQTTEYLTTIETTKDTTFTSTTEAEEDDYIIDYSTDMVTDDSQYSNDDIEIEISEDGEYLTVDSVAEYIMLYSHLPENYLTKEEAMELGWVSSEGNLWEVADGMCIGGDVFFNYDDVLPDANGRQWYECDVNYSGGFRNAERIVYSNDGLVYYTNDHYETFRKIS